MVGEIDVDECVVVINIYYQVLRRVKSLVHIGRSSCSSAVIGNSDMIV